MQVLTQEITRLFRKCEVRLQRFGQGPSSSEADEKASLLACLLRAFMHGNNHLQDQQQA